MDSYRRRKLERRAYAEQSDEIEKRFDRKAAEAANYGWGVDGNDNALSIATKVYRGQPYTVLVTDVDLVNGTITHDWRS